MSTNPSRSVGSMDRRDFLLRAVRGRQRVLELSCERLGVRYVDALSGAGPLRAEDDSSAMWEGEPPTRVATQTVAELFAELDRALESADVLHVLDPEWLEAADLRRHVEPRIDTFRRRGGRVEDARVSSTPKSRASALVLLLAACLTAPAAAQTVPDDVLTTRIGAALAAATDLPADSITVAVRDGIVTLSGSVLCGECGGNQTPPGSGTVQQSVGAVVRAVPGVTSVRFVLVYEPPAAPNRLR